MRYTQSQINKMADTLSLGRFNRMDRYTLAWLLTEDDELADAHAAFVSGGIFYGEAYNGTVSARRLRTMTRQSLVDHLRKQSIAKLECAERLVRQDTGNGQVYWETVSEEVRTPTR
ncbi:MAG: hypothetical protein JO232_09890 [Verrucomicrobia bacterium]|jgi:hypothetical protein|nr:hypothetical protein [Verrucomicrobiota bacterium]